MEDVLKKGEEVESTKERRREEDRGEKGRGRLKRKTRQRNRKGRLSFTFKNMRSIVTHT